jgi:HEAT repeat protein
MEEKLTLDALLARIASDDPDVRTQAWLAAGSIGAPAIKPLAAVVRQTEKVVERLAGDPKNKELAAALESHRAAKRAMWQIVRTAGDPGRDAERKAVEAELLGLVGGDQPACVRREVFWMLSEIGGDATLAALRDHPEILDDKHLREDARAMVERIPGAAAVAMLKEALEEVPDEFKINIVQSLRVRGVKVDPKKYPCQKLVPTKQTAVTPVGR